MLKLISSKICPFVQRVAATLEAKGVPYEAEYINLREKSQWFLEVSPSGQVPVLVTESGAALFESSAIVEYVDDTAGALEANLSAEQRAVERAWSYEASKNYLMQCSAMRSPDADTLHARAEKLRAAFIKIEKHLNGGRYFKGNGLSKVDIAWLPLLHRAAVIERLAAYDFLAGCQKVKKWQAALLENGIAEKSVADDFESAFAEFYLSNETYLGRNGDEASYAESPRAKVACC